MTAAIWLSLALAALIAEFLSGTFYLLIVSAALLLAAACHWLGLSLVTQLIAASVSGLIGVALLHRWRHRHPQILTHDDPDIGQPVLIVRQLGEHRARVLFRGAQWDARLENELAPGDTAFITARDGNLLIVGAHPPKETP